MNKELQAKLREQGIIFTGSSLVGGSMLLDCEAPVLIGCDISMRGSIGAFSYIRGGRIAGGLKKIGRYCSIAPGVTAGDSNHALDWLSSHPFQYGGGSLFRAWSKKLDFPFMKMKPPKSAASVIGNDVWIGANAIIMPGVTIGDGAAVGAGSVVTRDVPPYAIVVGAPAKVIRFRFEQSIIDQLLELKWWRFEADSLLGVNFDCVEKAIDQIKELESQGRLELIDRDPIRIVGAELKKRG